MGGEAASRIEASRLMGSRAKMVVRVVVNVQQVFSDLC
jgi:hypothetical protein